MSQPGRLLSLFTTVITSPSAPASADGLPSATSDWITGSREVDEVIRTLPGLDLVRLLKFVRDWNANARTAPIAQVILHAVLKLRSADDLLAAFDSTGKLSQLSSAAPDDGGNDNDEVVAPAVKDGEEKKPKKRTHDLTQAISMKELLEGLIPYSERHFTRIDKLVQESYMLDYVLGEMDGGIFGAEIMDVDE